MDLGEFGQAGLDAVVYAINRVGLDQYIPKPWDEPDLRLTIQNLLSRYRLERERENLLSELQSKNAELAALNSSSPAGTNSSSECNSIDDWETAPFSIGSIAYRASSPFTDWSHHSACRRRAGASA